MRLRPSPGNKRIFGVFRVQVTCLVAVNIVPLTLGEANSASPNPLAGFKGGERSGPGTERNGIKSLRKYIRVSVYSVRALDKCARLLELFCDEFCTRIVSACV